MQKKRVARILFFKIRPSQEILKIRDGTPLEAEKILTYIKRPRNGSRNFKNSRWYPFGGGGNFYIHKRPSNGSVCYFSGKLDVPSNVVQKKRVAQILFFKIRPSQEILKIRDGTPLEAEESLTYIKRPRNGSVCYFSSKLDVSSNVVQKKKVARILFFKIRPSQEILKIRDGTPLEAEEILTYIKSPRNGSKRVAQILFFKIKLSKGILKIRDVTPMEAEEILTYIKSPRNGSVCYFSSKLDVPSNVVKKKRVARILFFKIRPSQEILKIRDGTPLEAEKILTYIKRPRNGSVCYFSSKLDVSSNVVQKKRVAQILFFKIKLSKGILKIRDVTPMEAEEILTYIKSPRNGSVCYFSSKLDVPSNVVKKKRVARILFFKIRPSQEILKIRDGTPLEAEKILTYIKRPRNGSVCYFSSKLDVSSNVVQKKRVAQILFFKIRPSQEILKIRDFTPLGAEEILTYIKRPRNGSVCYFSSKLDVSSNVVQKKKVARILFFKIRPSQEILKIRDGTPLEAEEILTYIKSPRNGSKRVAQILFFKIKLSKGILKIRDVTPMEAEEILTYIKSPRNGSVCYFSSKLDVPSNVVKKKRVARILFFKIRPSQEILKIRDGTPLEAEKILTYIKRPRNGSVCYFSSKLDVSSNVVQKKRVAQILFFKIKLSKGILKIRDVTPMEAEEILTYIKSPRNGSVCYFSSKLDVPSNVVKKKRVARILFFKIRPSQEILKIRDGTPLEAEKILTYIKRPRNGSVCYFSSKLDVSSNVVQKKRVAQILFFKIRPSQEILKIRDFTPLGAEEILTYIKRPRNGSVCYFSSKLDVSSNVVQNKKVARILFFKIRPSQEILKIRDGTPLEQVRYLSKGILKIRDVTPMEAEEILTYIKSPRNGSVCYFSSKLDVPSNVVKKKRVARILFFKIRPSQEILKIRDGTPLEAEKILTYIKRPRNGSVCYFSSKLDVSSNVVQKKRVAQILFFKIRPSQEILKIRDFTPLGAEEILTYIKRPRNGSLDLSQGILKIRDVTPMEAEEILTYIKRPRNGSVCYFSTKLDVSSNVIQKKKVAQILFFKIRPSQEILKIRDGTPLEAEEILTYIKRPRNGSVCYFSSKLDVSSNVVQKKKVARILFFKIRPSQEILKIRDGTPLEAEEILTYIKRPRNGSVCYFSSKLDVSSNVVQKKKVARILFFKIRPSQEILKIRDGTPLEAEEILTYIKSPRNGSQEILTYIKRPRNGSMPSQEILKIRDGTPLEAEEILTYIKSPRNGSVCYFSSKLDVSSNVVQKKRVARILFFKIRPSQEILKIRDGTPLEAEKILTYIKRPRNGSLDVPSNVVQKKRVAQILFFKIRPSQEILKIRDGTPLEAEESLTYIKRPRNGSVCYFSSKLDVSSNVVQKKKVARILFFKIRPSQEILKIRDARILKIRDVTPMEAEEILTYIKSPRNGSVCYFSSKLDVPSNVVKKKRVARILFFKIRPSQEILKIRDGTPLEAEEIFTYIKVQKKRVAQILFFKIRPSQEILKIRDGTPLEAEESLTYIKRPRNGSVCYFSSKLDVSSNVVQKKKVARILFFKIRPSQEILKIRDGTPLEAEEILTYIKSPRNGSLSKGILKIRDVTPMEAEEILTYIKSPRNGSVCYFSSKLDVPSNVVKKKRVARILFFKIRPSQEILKIRDGTPLEAEKNFDIHKTPSKRIVAQILFFKIRPSQEILKIRDFTPLGAEEILTYIKRPRNGLVCYFSSKLDVSSNVVQNKKVARILFFKIRPSQEILKIRDGTPLEAEEILTYIKSPRNGPLSQGILKIRDVTPMEAEEILTYIKRPRNGSVCYFSTKLDVSSNVIQKKKVAQILFFKIRPSQEILKIRDGTPLEAEEILTYIKRPRNGSVCYFSSKLDVSSNVVQKKKVARILFFKIRPSQEILKIRDGTPLELAQGILKIRDVTPMEMPSREILKIRDGTPLEAEEILTYIKRPRNGSVCYFSSKLDVSSNVVQKKKVARILFFKIRPSQEILKIRDGTPLEMPSQEILKIRDFTPLGAEEILTYIKRPRNGSVCYFSSKLDVSSNVVQKKKVARILFFKIRPSQEILKIRDGTPLEAEEILTYIKSPRNGSKKKVARILFFKIKLAQGILKIRDVTPMEAEEILTYIKRPRNGSPSREILKIRDGTPLEAEEILTYIKRPRNGSVCYFSSKLDVSSNVVQKKKVARILFFKIRPSQEILKIRDGTPLEAEEILTYIKSPRNGSAEKILTYIKRPRNGSVCYFSSKLDVSSNVVQKKKVARILFFKIKLAQGILKIRDVTPMEAEEILTYIKRPRNGSNVVQKKKVAQILFFKIRPSQEILKIRDGTPLEAEEILTYIKRPRNGSVCYFSSKLDVSSNVVQKKKVARILFFKIRPSQEILKIRDGTPLELDVPSNVVQKKRVARILFFKIKLAQGILKIRDVTPMEAEEILTYIKRPRNGSVCYFSSKLDVSSNVIQKKKVAQILFFKIRPSQEILKIRDGTPLEAEEILTYIKRPRNGSVCYFSSKLDVSSNVVQKKKVARILFFKIRPSQEILKIRDGTPLEAEEILTYIKSPRNGSLDVPSNVVQKKRVARILFFKIRPSQEILKIRDFTPLGAEEILTYIKRPRNGSVCYFSSKLDVSSNVVQKKKVARILFFKIRPSQEILKIRDGTPLEAEEILTYIKSPRNGSKKKVARILFFKIKLAQGILKIRDVTPMEKKRVAQILFFKIRPSREILKIRDGTPLEAEEILTYIKRPRNGSVCYFSSKLDVSSNVVQKKKVARILFFKIRPSQEILKIRDGTPLEAISRNFKIRDGTPLEAEKILTYIKRPRNGSVCYFSSKLDVSSNVVQKKKVARILFFKIKLAQGILKIRDVTPMEAEEILTYIKRPRNGSFKKKVAQILFFKIRPSQEILKIRDGTPLEAEEILTYIKRPRNGSVCYFSSKLDVSSNVVQKKKVARILFFKIRPSQEILKIRDGTPLEAEEILTYIKSPRNGSILDVPSNVVQKKRVARILFFKIKLAQGILKIRDVTPMEAEEILTYIKRPRNGSVCYFSSKLDVSSNVIQKKKVAQILFFKIRPSQEILKIRDGTPLEAEEILTYIKRPRNGSVCYFSSKLDVSSNVVQKKKVARILFFKIRPSQEILKIRDGTPLEAEEILTYIKSPRNGSVVTFLAS
ncbi:hypothetical protein OROHE_011324 [Orobanche hederae]